MSRKNKTSRKFVFISNIKINVRIALFCLFSLLPSIVLLVTMMYIITTDEMKKKAEFEQTIIAASEQYINTSIENVVSVAKTFYTNSALYDFVNIEYGSPEEYYDAFYKLNSSKYLVIADNDNIRAFTIYTANNTVLSGGNISRLDTVKNEKWYQEFSKLGKDMILYCDADKRTLSFINKLNYYSIDTGECIIKLDINSNTIQDCFASLEYKGKIYVMSGGSLLYSNDSSADTSNTSITSSYSCFTKNYYTAAMEYYACTDNRRIVEIISDNGFYLLPFLCLYVISVLFTYLLMRDVSTRITRLSDSYEKNGRFTGFDTESCGTDEIGGLYKSCGEISYQLDTVVREGVKLSELLNNYIDDNNALMLNTLNLDAAFYYGLIMHPELEEAVIAADGNHLISLKRETEAAKSFLTHNKHTDDKPVRLTVSDDNNISDELFVPPFSLALILVDIATHAVSDSDETELSLTVGMEEKNCSITISYEGANISSGRLLKLRAIFEKESENYTWNFTPNYKYNSYFRLKQYYKDDISALLSSSGGFKISLLIRADAMRIDDNSTNIFIKE